MILSSNTQEIIEIFKIKDGLISYIHYENTNFRSKKRGLSYSVPWTFDENTVPNGINTVKEHKYKLAYQHLSTLPKFDGFVLIQDSKAWTLENKPIRLFIDNDQILKSIDSKDGLNTIIERLRDENAQSTEKFIFRGKNQTVLYLTEIMGDDAPVVDPLINNTIFIETK